MGHFWLGLPGPIVSDHPSTIWRLGSHWHGIKDESPEPTLTLAALPPPAFRAPRRPLPLLLSAPCSADSRPPHPRAPRLSMDPRQSTLSSRAPCRFSAPCAMHRSPHPPVTISVRRRPRFGRNADGPGGRRRGVCRIGRGVNSDSWHVHLAGGGGNHPERDVRACSQHQRRRLRQVSLLGYCSAGPNRIQVVTVRFSFSVFLEFFRVIFSLADLCSRWGNSLGNHC